jgi:hypothetical protein
MPDRSNMSESKTITVPNNIPVDARIEEAKTQIFEWMRSLDKPFRPGKDTLSLVKCRQKEHAYSLCYKIQREAMPPRKAWTAEK